MKKRNLWMFSIISILWFSFLLVGCDSNNWEKPNTTNPTESSNNLLNNENENLPDNEVTSVMKNFLKGTNADAKIEEDTFEWLNYAEYDYNNYNEWYYDITWYTLSITGVKAFPDVNKIFDGWYVRYIWDEVWWSAIDYSKDNIICSYFLSLEQEIPYELLNREWDYDDEQQQAEFDKKRSEFYDIASYSVNLSCGYIPEWAILFKDFNFYGEWMEPFWRTNIAWDYISIFTPDGMEEHYIDTVKSEWDNFSFKWYDFDWKLEKSDCLDWWKWDIHEYKISFDVNKYSYWDDWVRRDEWTIHYEWCADKENPKFIPWEEWSLENFIKKSWYNYTKNYDQDKISYNVAGKIGKYMLVNFYMVNGDEYDSYQNIIEESENGFKVLYEWEWYDISDEECEKLNQYDNNLMDMFFLKSCPRG